MAGPRNAPDNNNIFASVSSERLIPRPTYARVDAYAIKYNLAQVRQLLNKGGIAPRVWATVKEDAYGHGIVHAIAGLQGVDGLAVLDPAQAQICRKAGWRGPILIYMGLYAPVDAMLINDPNLHLVITNTTELEWLQQWRPARPPTLWLRYSGDFHHTGFGRASYAQAYEKAAAMKRRGLVAEVGHLNHYALNYYTPVEQIEDVAHTSADFLDVIQGLPGPVCTGSSTTLLLHRKHLLRDDWVRPGLMLYGASPLAGYTAPALNLRPAMSLHSQIVGVRQLPAGTTIRGVNLSLTAKHDIRIGVVACGYGDGYPRQAPTGTPVLVAGVRTRLLGTVAMDTLMVDLNPIPEAHPGTAVTLWGTRALPIEEVASHASTVAAALMTGLAPRVPIRAAYTTP